MRDLINEGIKEVKSKDRNDYFGFGGWLYFITGYQIFVFYRMYVNIFESNLPFMKTEEWRIATTPGETYFVDYVELYAYFSICFSALVLIIIVIIAMLTIKQSKFYKLSQIFFLALMLLFSLLDSFFMNLINSHNDYDLYEVNTIYSAIITPLIICSIWIPYFIKSRRVSNTFYR